MRLFRFQRCKFRGEGRKKKAGSLTIALINKQHNGDVTLSGASCLSVQTGAPSCSSASVFIKATENEPINETSLYVLCAARAERELNLVRAKAGSRLWLRRRARGVAGVSRKTASCVCNDREPRELWFDFTHRLRSSSLKCSFCYQFLCISDCGYLNLMSSHIFHICVIACFMHVTNLLEYSATPKQVESSVRKHPQRQPPSNPERLCVSETDTYCERAQPQTQGPNRQQRAPAKSPRASSNHSLSWNALCCWDTHTVRSQLLLEVSLSAFCFKDSLWWRDVRLWSLRAQLVHILITSQVFLFPENWSQNRS